jgi:hypothetical protein
MDRAEFEKANKAAAEALSKMIAAIKRDEQERTTESRFAVLDAITVYLMDDSELSGVFLGDLLERIERIEGRLGIQAPHGSPPVSGS